MDSIRCERCQISYPADERFCARCGKSLQSKPTLWHWRTAIFIASALVLVAVVLWILAFKIQRTTTSRRVSQTASPAMTPNPTPKTIAHPASPVRPSVKEESGDTPTRNEAQRLARASEVRHYLRDNNIPATVVASGLNLSVQYEAASGDYLQEIFRTFCRQQNITSLRTAGFQTIEIRARDSYGDMQSRTFVISECGKF